MTLIAWQATVQDDEGNVIVNPSFTVRRASDGELADIFDGEGSALDNPYTGTSEGFVQFFAQPGKYTVQGARGGSVTQTWTVDLVSPAGKQYPSRSAFVDDVAAGYAPADGTVAIADGLSYVRSAGATVIPELPGWLPVKNSGFISPGHFGGGAAGLKAAWEWSKFIELEAGQTYTLSGSGDTLFSRGSPVHFRGYNARIEQTEGNEIIAVSAGHEHTQNLNGVSEVDGNTVLSVTNAGLYNRGDVLFIRSEDGIPSFPDRRRGEFVIVFDVDTGSNTVTVLNQLRYEYPSSGSPQITRMRNEQIVIEGLNVGYVGNREGTVSPANSLIYVQSAIAPRIENIVCDFSWGDVIHVRNCYAWRTRNVHTYYQANQDNDWHTGATNYSVRVSNCAGGFCDTGSYGHGRHAVDFLCSNNAGPSEIRTSEDLVGAGGCYDNQVRGWYGQGGSQAPFSSHDGTEDIEWIDCKAVQAINVGFQFRGDRHRAVNCGTDRCPIGFRTFVQSAYEGIASSSGSEFIDCWSINPASTMFQFRGGTGDHRVVSAKVIFNRPDLVPLRLIHFNQENNGTLILNGLDVVGDTDISSLRRIIQYEDISSGAQAFVSNVTITADNNSDTNFLSFIEANGSGEIVVNLSNCVAQTRNGIRITMPAIVTGSAGINNNSVVRNCHLLDNSLSGTVFGRPGFEVHLSGGPTSQPNNRSTLLGREAGRDLTTGGEITAIGADALQRVTTGTRNVGVGYNALSRLTSGGNNVSIGTESGREFAPGAVSAEEPDNVVLVGYRSGVGSVDARNAIAIGANAVAEGRTGTSSSHKAGDIALGSANNPSGTRGDGTPFEDAGDSAGYLRIRLNGSYYRIELREDN